MKGITYLHAEEHHLKAVQIDVELPGEALQDFLDGLEAEALKLEPKTSFDEVARRILAKSAWSDFISRSRKVLK